MTDDANTTMDVSCGEITQQRQNNIPPKHPLMVEYKDHGCDEAMQPII